MTMHPIAIRIGDIVIHWYGLMMALGFLAGYLVMSRRAKQIGFRPEWVGDIVITAVIGGILGSRIYYVIGYWDKFKASAIRDGVNPYIKIFYVHEGGLVFLGGFFGATILMLIMAKWRKIPALYIADLAALGLPLGHLFGRLGCFFNGCCYGRPHETFPRLIYPAKGYGHILRKHKFLELITEKATESFPVYPVQLFSGLANLTIFFIILGILKSGILKKRGQLFACLLMLYPIGRFTNEFFRGDHDSKHRHFTDIWERGLTDAQVLAPFIFSTGLILFLLVTKFAGPVAQNIKLDAPPATDPQPDNDETKADDEQ